jgi:hypothetical protein
MESKPEPGKLGKALRSESNLGLLCRVGLFSMLMPVLLAGGYLAGSLPAFPSVTLADLLTAFFAVFIPMAASIVLAERPKGDDWIILRLGLATFCRTGLPIICVAVITLLSKKPLQLTLLGFLAFFYISGILVVVLISVYRLSESKAGSGKNDEVDRAPIT